MNSFILLIWISLVVIVHIRADVLEDDICAQCNEATLPKCQSTDRLEYNKIINCQNAGEETCVIGVVKNRQDSETHEEDVICVMDGAEEQEESSITLAPQHTMLPIPLTLSLSTTEPTPIEGGVEMNGETLPPAGVEMVAQPTEEAATENTNIQLADEVTVDVESLPQTAGYVETATGASQPQPVADVETTMEDGQQQLAEAAMLAESQSEPAADMAANATPFKPIEENTIEPVVDAAMQTAELGDYQADAAESVFESNTENTQGIDEDNNTEMAVNLQQPSESPAETVEPENVVQPSDDEQESSMSAITESIVQMEQVTVQVPNAFQSCYECTSTNDQQCIKKPIRQINCKASEGQKNGCYTLLKADTNVTTRGCISDLTEEGMKYCKKNAKLCILCYDSGCNNRQAPSSAPGYSYRLNALILLATVGFLTFA